MYPIPCDWENDVVNLTIENFSEWNVSVSGSATLSGKVSLGNALLGLLGRVDVSVSVTVGGLVGYTQRNEWSLSLTIHQQDCYDQTREFFKTTKDVSGTVTEWEQYEWQLLDRYICGTTGDPDDPFIWCDCPSGPVMTQCTRSASGTGQKVAGLDIMSGITPCCPTIHVQFPETPCCGRDCER